jgi:hypothetical protein
MIELLWNNLTYSNNENMMYISNFIAWLATSIVHEKSLHQIELNGFLTLKDSDNKVATLLLCDSECQREVLNILQQPPNEYKEKYIARVPCNEPSPVNEEQNKESDEDIINVTDKT